MSLSFVLCALHGSIMVGIALRLRQKTLTLRPEAERRLPPNVEIGVYISYAIIFAFSTLLCRLLFPAWKQSQSNVACSRRHLVQSLKSEKVQAG